MRLSWHIARKDLRRFAAPVAVWLAFIVVGALWFRSASPGQEGNIAAGINGWSMLMTIWTRLLLFVQMLFGFLLAGTLVLEDALVGADRFWMTRPIANGRLLVAKLLAGGILFVGGPVLVQLPLWWLSGFGGGQIAAATVEATCFYAVNLVFAFGIAALSRNLPQFLISAVGLFAAYLVSTTLLVDAAFFHGVSAEVRRSRTLLVTCGTIPVLAVVLVQQFLTRRVMRGWATLGGALLLAWATMAVWPVDVWSGLAARIAQARSDERPEDRTANIVVPGALERFGRNPKELPNLVVRAPWSAEGFYAPARVMRLDGSTALELVSNWGRAAGLRVLGFDAETGPLTWQLTARGSVPAVSDDDALPLTGSLEVWWARARVVGEIPLEVDAQFVAGGVRTRIMEFAREGDRLDGVFVEEQDPYLWRRGDIGRGGVLAGLEGGPDHVDRYFLVDRAARRALHVSFSRLGMAHLNSLRITCGRLFVAGEHDWRNGSLVKVRIERERSFLRPFEVRGVTSREPGRLP